MAQSTKIRRFGLALSGGTLKAAAHVGVLSALEDLGFHPDCIAGTSAGAIVASLYAHGYRPTEMQQMIIKFPGVQLLDYGFPLLSSLLNYWRYRLPALKGQNELTLAYGLIRGKKLYHYLDNLLKKRAARMPYYVIATDLWTGKPITFTNDPARPCWPDMNDIQKPAAVVMGSCALPGILTPVTYSPYLLADGALRHYVPVDVLRQAGCRRIVAVNLYRLDQNWQPQTFVHVLVRSLDILLQETVDQDTVGKDVMVLQPSIKEISWLSINHMRVNAVAGRVEVYGQADRLRSFLSSPD